MAYKEEYNKAIDDAKSVILQTLDNEILVDTLHLRLEQLKDEMYETCKDCPYYYGEINWCMYGEEDVPDYLEKKCNKEK